MSEGNCKSCSDMDDSCLNILLIDDDPAELVVIRRVLSALTEAPICVDHVKKCSEAVRQLNTANYDLVLLDNRLSPTISAEFSVPFIRSSFSQADIAIISNDVDVPYLRNPDRLGVDHVVDKAQIVSFLREQVERRVRFTPHGEEKGYSRRRSAS